LAVLPAPPVVLTVRALEMAAHGHAFF